MNIFVNPAITNRVHNLSVEIYDYARTNFGKKHELRAWSDFLGMKDEEFRESRFFYEVFNPWYLYRWKHPGQTALACQYLMEHSDSLTEPEKLFIDSLLQAEQSFYQVEEVGLNHYLVLKDLLSRRKVIVFEKSATRSLQKGDIIFTRIASVVNLHFLVGTTSLPIPKDFLPEIKKFASHRTAKKYELRRIAFYFDLLLKVLEANDERMSER